MFSTTTAILVVHRGGEQLSRVVEALAAQTRRPDQLAVVLADAPDVREVLTPLGAHTVIELHSFLSFGAAVEAAQRVVAGHPDDLMWVLSEDTIPAPDALEILATSLDTARSVAIAAPKLRNADDPDRLFGMGRTVTRFGRSVAIAVDELDQGQHDGLSDVLGVNPAGMLVRRSVWTSLGGIDPALTAVDDGLDLSVRARLAGHRVIVVPEARVDFAPGGVIGPPYGTARAMRRRARAERRAQLHRRLTWAPAAAVPLHWLSLLPLWIARSIGALLAKVPGRILPELSATLAAVFQWGRVASARRSIRRTRTTGWSSLLPLRAEPIELRRRARLDRDTQRAYGPRTDIDFLSTGGGWVLLGSLAASTIVFFWALAAPSLTGGGMLPLSSRLSVLWEHAASGTDPAGAADPFAAVLALLGSVTFWAPSFALVLLWLLAIPLSAMGAWFAVSRLHAPGAVRAVVAIGYAVAPPLLGALGDGRPGAVLAHSLLGWLTFALLGARRSWVAAGAAALLFAVISAAAPSLTPALVVCWLVCIGFAGRAAARLVLVIVPAVALWAPLVAAQILRQTPVALLADPGVPLVQNSVSVGRIAAGLSDHQIAAWHSVLTLVHPAPDARWVLFLVLPLAFSAVGAVAVGRGIRGVLALGAALLGFATAVAAGQISVSVRADDAVAIWPGAGQSLMWLGLLVAASITLTAARGIRSVVAGGLAAVLMAYSLPLLIAIAAGRVAVHAGGAREMPALVAAEAERDPHLTTLVVSPTRDGGARLRLVEGAGEVLDSTSTLVATGPELTESERVFAAWAGDLITRADADPVGEAADVRLRFVLLRPGDGSVEQIQLGQRALAALDANGNLVPVGETEFGRLWRVADPGTQDAPATRPMGWIWFAQLAVIAAVLLLSIPTGTHVSAGQRLDRLVRQRGKKRVSPAAAVDASADDAAELDPDESDPVAMRNEESNG